MNRLEAFRSIHLLRLVGSQLVCLFALVCSASVVIGAPKANTSQVNVTEGGSVFYCPWSLGQTDCHAIEFDTEGKSLWESRDPD